MKMPLVIDHSLIHSFICWHDGIQVGGSYNNELYTRHRVFSLKERLKAYEIAWEKAGQNINVCISVSDHEYTIWLSLRSLSINLQEHLLHSTHHQEVKP